MRLFQELPVPSVGTACMGHPMQEGKVVAVTIFENVKVACESRDSVRADQENR